MSFRKLLPALSFSLLLSALFAQTTSPDQKAYNEANAITDPEKKIEALTKFKTDHPESVMLRTADQAILATLVKKLPDQSDRIRKFADDIYRKSPEKDRGALANQIAVQFLGANLLLEEAADYARAGLNSMALSSYVNEQIASYRKRDQTPPWTRELEKRFRESRAVRVGTLGRIELRLGHTTRAQKLLEEAYAAQPTDALLQAALGELAAKAGNQAKALEYLIPAQLSGKSSKEGTAALEAIYRAQHSNSVEGLEAMLDREYHQRFPNPVHVDAYKPSAARSDRMVLAEVFTGSGCPPCAAADLAFDAAMERYSRKDLAVVMYHQHIPRPDPMTNPDTQARNKNFGVQGVPTFAINGKRTTGGGPREITRQTYDRFNPDIEKQLETPAEASLKADASLAGNIVSVKAAVDRVQSDSKDLKVHIALVEKELRFNGENGIRFHPMVVRAMGGKDGAGFDLDRAAPKVYEQSFNIDEVSKAIKTHLDAYEAAGHRGETFTFAEKKYQIDRAHLAVVVFVQDDKTKHVLQAAYVDLGAGPARPVITEASGSRR